MVLPYKWELAAILWRAVSVPRYGPIQNVPVQQRLNDLSKYIQTDSDGTNVVIRGTNIGTEATD